MDLIRFDCTGKIKDDFDLWTNEEVRLYIMMLNNRDKDIDTTNKNEVC